MSFHHSTITLTLVLGATIFGQSYSCGKSGTTNNSNGTVQTRNINSTMTSNANSTIPDSSQTPGEVSRGTWGGQGITLQVSAEEAKIEFDCAHATITDKMVANREGKFEAKGFFVREKGGPVRAGEDENREPAIYTGTMEGKTLTLTVKLVDSEEVIGTFNLTHGQTGRIRKCL